MNNLNKIFFAILMTVFLLNIGVTKATTPAIRGNLVEYQESCSADNQEISEAVVLMDCTLRFKTEDGTDLEVTFHDVTWFQCTKMKVGKWLKETF